ncbi:myosin phosphatase Rho-interacting protein-like [Centropristis striata]|uniref:myosin phosphatase Rho-interacting protein-like n=1 Tax=Centropristis striata TaxID=184440 RepID=UPI0027E0885D|nr:myosin phosphatase Rho-interacting protein-like [Centropristis striata]
MSRLDEHGKWRKHWFVLRDTSLRFYRDSEAEESDDLDGEINLKSCVNASDCDVEKNYGLQIKTKRAVFTLSVMTSRIRRNWVKLLNQAIQNKTHQSDTGSEKENPLSRRPSSCQPPARFTCRDSGYEPTTSTSNNTAANSHQAENQNRSGDEDLDLSPASQREEGEGWDREQAKRLEERNKC